MSKRIFPLATLCTVFAFLVVGAARAEEGMAVHYHDKFQGRRTACGETFDQQALTAAHKKLPFGTQVKVTNLKNNRSIVVKINDRMARKNRNVIDVTRRAACELGFGKKSRAYVRIDVVQ